MLIQILCFVMVAQWWALVSPQTLNCWFRSLLYMCSVMVAQQWALLSLQKVNCWLRYYATAQWWALVSPRMVNCWFRYFVSCLLRVAQPRTSWSLQLWPRVWWQPGVPCCRPCWTACLHRPWVMDNVTLATHPDPCHHLQYDECNK